MAILSININKIALIRNARGTDNPNILDFIQKFIQLGIKSVTIHPRPDERHIRFEDAEKIKQAFPHIELNIEGYPSKTMLKLIHNVKPTQFTLVPDKENAITSNNGWNCKKYLKELKDIISPIKILGIRTSIFLNPEKNQIPYAAETGTDRIELFTEKYAQNFHTSKNNRTIQRYKETAEIAQKYHLEINAGHDLNQENLTYFIQKIPFIKEVSIGHAFVIDMLLNGIEKTTLSYLSCLSQISQ